MWRARSDGDDRPLHNDDNRIGSGGVSPSGSADDRSVDDPRSEPTGRKIRRIESGPPGLGAERGRPGPASGPSLARRRPGGQNGQGAPGGHGAAAGRNGSGSEDPRAGRAGSAARRGRPAGRPDADTGTNGTSGTGFGAASVAGGGASAGGLPPLRQPTGETPAVPGPDAATPSSTASGSDRGTPSDEPGGWPTDLPVKGVFGADDGDIDLTAASDPLDDLASKADRSIDSSMPSALSAAGSAGAAGRAGASAAAAGMADDVRSAASGASDRAKGLADTARSGAGGLADGVRSAASDATAAMPSAFPDTDGRPGDNSFPSWTAAKSDTPSSIDETLAMGPMAGGRGSRTAGRSGQGSGDRRPASGAGQSAGLGARTAGSQRMQETEIKLAGRQGAPEKPREPNRLLLGLALALVVLAGAAVAWWLTRDDGAADVAGEQEQLAETTTTLAEGDAAAAPEPDAPAVEEPVLDVPTLSLLDVDPGPLDSETTYSLDLFGEPAGSTLQVIVDDVPQGQPDVILPDLILPPGRHTLLVNVTDAAGTRLSSPIEVYVLDAPPALGTLANLASIDMVNEGWDEAIRRFDEYRAAGHQNLRILPITPGFWNIFVPDQADAAAVAAYCEGFGLVVPEDCFAKDFDPATYQGPTPAAAPAAGDGTDTADDGSTTDSDDGAMTDEGGTDTSTSTTTGG